MQIRKLPEDVQSYIRTGINLTSISQFVTELVLNSLDAEATKVGVRIDLRKYQLQVVDDGLGLNKQQLNLIGERYMTSKCRTLRDLKTNLKYFGFRGEALASIRKACDTVLIFSKPLGEDATYCKVLKPNDDECLEASRAQIDRPGYGTTVVVMDIMGNLPVRQNRIHHSIEIEHVKYALQMIALVHPQVSFTLRNDLTKSIIMHTRKCADIIQNACQLFNFEVNGDLNHVYVNEKNFKVTGYFSRNVSKTKKYQFVYVNKRFIHKNKIYQFVNTQLKKSFYLKGIDVQKNKKVTYDREFYSRDFELSEGFDTDHAVFIIIIECPLSDYDICLDPKKQTVEFKNWNLVFDCLDKCISKFLDLEKFLHNVNYTLSNNENEVTGDANDLDTQANNRIEDIEVLKQVCLPGSGSHSQNKRNLDREEKVTNQNSIAQLEYGVAKSHVDSPFSFSTEKRDDFHLEHLLTDCDECKTVKTDITADSYKRTIIPVACKEFYEYNLEILKTSVNFLQANCVSEPLLSKYTTPKCVLNSNNITYISIKKDRKLKHLCKQNKIKLQSKNCKERRITTNKVEKHSIILRRNVSMNNSNTHTYIIRSNSSTKSNVIIYDNVISKIKLPFGDGVNAENENFRCKNEKKNDFVSNYNFKNITENLRKSSKCIKYGEANCISSNKEFFEKGNYETNILTNKFTNLLLNRNSSNQYYNASSCLINETVENKSVNNLYSFTPSDKQSLLPHNEFRLFNNSLKDNCTLTNNKDVLVNFENIGLSTSNNVILSGETEFADKKQKSKTVQDTFGSRISENKLPINKINSCLYVNDSVILNEPIINTCNVLSNRTNKEKYSETDDNILSIHRSVSNQKMISITLKDLYKRSQSFRTDKGNLADSKIKQIFLFDQSNNVGNAGIIETKNDSLCKQNIIYLSKCFEKLKVNEEVMDVAQDEFDTYSDTEVSQDCVNLFSTQISKPVALQRCDKELKENGDDECVISNTISEVHEPVFNNENNQQNENIFTEYLMNSCHNNDSLMLNKSSDSLNKNVVSLDVDIPQNVNDNEQNNVNTERKCLNSYNIHRTQQNQGKFNEIDFIYSLNLKHITSKEKRRSKINTINNTEEKTFIFKIEETTDQSSRHCDYRISGNSSVKRNLYSNEIDVLAENNDSSNVNIHVNSIGEENIEQKNITITSDVMPDFQNKTTKRKYSSCNDVDVIDYYNNCISNQKKICANVNNLQSQFISQSPSLPVTSAMDANDVIATVDEDESSSKNNYSCITNLSTEKCESKWKEHKLSTGRNIYIHKKTGMSSYTPPKETADYNLSSRLWFLPKGISPLQDFLTSNEDNDSKIQLTENEKDNLLSAIKVNDLANEDDTSLIKWKYSQYKGDELPQSELFGTLNSVKSSIPLFNTNLFSKEDLKNAEVIGLLDDKFIVSTIVSNNNKFIVVFDQHAVDERIKYETLYQVYRNDDGFISIPINQPLCLTVTDHKCEIINNFNVKFEKLGLKLIVNEDGKIVVSGVPVCLYNRAEKESSNRITSKLIELVCKLIDEQIESIMNTGGAGLTVPHTINSVISYEACRGAVKFGDKLTLNAASLMIEQLSDCSAPFHCAHGRPVLIPLYNLE